MTRGLCVFTVADQMMTCFDDAELHLVTYAGANPQGLQEMSLKVTRADQENDDSDDLAVSMNLEGLQCKYGQHLPKIIAII